MLTVELLGQVRIGVDGRPVEGLPNPRLLAYLVVHRDRVLTRQQVAFALWPDSGDAQALTNLRRELHLLRRTLPDAEAVLALDGRTLRWRADAPVRLDVEAFEAAAELGRAGDPAALAEAVELYRGDLLPTLYDDWVGPLRERLRDRYGETLEQLIARREERRDYRAAVELARRLVAHDPLRERAYGLQMRLAVLLGDRSAALQAYHACAATLRRELDVDPGPDIRTAYERLLAGSGDEASRAVPSREQAPSVVPVHALVGRGDEWRELLAAWQAGLVAGPRLIAVRGEPGIGKTRLIEELERWCRAHGAATAATRSYAAEGALAYAPVAAWLRAGPVLRAVPALEPVWLAEVARLVPEVLVDRQELARPEPMTEGWQRQRLFEALVRAFRLVPGPLLLVLDDAHWTDRDTLEWLHYLLRGVPAPPLVVVAGVRTEEESASPALGSLLVDLRNRGQLHELALGRLPEADTAELAAAILGAPLDADERASLHRETGGNPLFVIEVARTGVGGGSLAGSVSSAALGRGPAGTTLTLPPRMQAVIAARLDRLAPDSRHLVDVASTIGRAFTIDVLAEASDLDENALVRALDDLWRRQIVRDVGAGGYDFSHDRFRDVAAASIAPGRRRLLHRRVARAIEVVHGADLDPLAAQLAVHYEAAGMDEPAIAFYERAAALAGRLSAHADASHHLARALALVRGRAPSAERDRAELALVMARSAPLNATQGYASTELEAALERSRELAATLDEREPAILALNGLFHVQFVRGRTRRAVELAEAALELIADDARFVAMGQLALAGPLTSAGQLDRAIAAFEASLAAYDPERSRWSVLGLDPSVFAMAWSSHALWLRGEWTAAETRAAAAVARAEKLDQPFLRALAHAYAAIHAQMASSGAARSHARQAIVLCEQYGFPYYGEWGTILEAWLDRDRRPDGPQRIEAALDAQRALGAESRRPYYLALLAETLVAAGRTGHARSVLDAALATGYANEDRWWLPEIHRAIGEAEPGSGGDGSLETAFALAIDQGSLSLAIRAATSLAARRPERVAALARPLGELARGLDGEAADLARTLLTRAPATS